MKHFSACRTNLYSKIFCSYSSYYLDFSLPTGQKIIEIIWFSLYIYILGRFPVYCTPICFTISGIIYMYIIYFEMICSQDWYTKPLTSVQCWHVHCEECWLRTLVSITEQPHYNLIQHSSTSLETFTPTEDIVENKVILWIFMILEIIFDKNTF